MNQKKIYICVFEMANRGSIRACLASIVEQYRRAAGVAPKSAVWNIFHTIPKWTQVLKPLSPTIVFCQFGKIGPRTAASTIVLLRDISPMAEEEQKEEDEEE